MKVTSEGRSKFRIGTEFPTCLDVSQVDSCCDVGILATFYGYTKKLRGAELRLKDNVYGLFLLNDENAELPEWWKDSKLVWELKD